MAAEGRPQPPERVCAVDAGDVARHVASQKVAVRSGFLMWLLIVTAGIMSLIVLGSVFSGSAVEWSLVFVLPTAWVAHSMRALRRDVWLARAALAAESLGLESVGALVEALSWPDATVETVAHLRLQTLLPAMAADAAEKLSQEHRSVLYDRLSVREAWRRPAFAAAVLQAMPLIGGERALRHVQRLAALPGWVTRLRAVRQAAREALPGLERLVARQREAGLTHAAARDTEAAPAAGRQDAARQVDRIAAEARSAPRMRLPFLLASWGILVPGCLLEAVYYARLGEWPLALGFALVGAGATQLHRFTFFTRHARMAHALAELDDPSAAGALAEAIEWPDAAARAGALVALGRLLPRLGPREGAALTGRQRSCLYQCLLPDVARANPDLVVKLLRALEQIGDRDAMPFVERLASREHASASLQRVREAALECLPVLREVADRNQDSHVLLRPAHGPENDTDLLVRPAQSAPEADPALLVRPAAADPQS